MINVRISQDADREKLIACADSAFGDSVPVGGFAGLLPKLYGPGARVGGNHLIAEEDGEILGVVLAEPMEYRVFGERLKIASVGTVSVAGQARGRGIMRLLMDETMRRLREEGFDLAFLGGQRQRYAYWGFQGCGTQMGFSWNQANLKHGSELPQEERIELVPMGVPVAESRTADSAAVESHTADGAAVESRTADSAAVESRTADGAAVESRTADRAAVESRTVDSAAVESRTVEGASTDSLPKNTLREADPRLTEAAWRMWAGEEVGVRRDRERFFDILCSWQGKPYACMRQGRFAGYVVLGPSEDEGYARILEMVLEDGVSVPALLHALSGDLGITRGSVKPGYIKQGQMRELEEFCEGESLGCSQRFLILDWCRVLRAMMTMKQHVRPLEDGEIILGITGEDGKRTGVWIRIREGCLTVAGEEERNLPRPEQKEETGSEDMHVPVRRELTAAQAARLLFRSTQVFYKELEGLPAGWFPLPLYVSEQDCC